MRYMQVDESLLSVVVVCNRCQWRATRATRPAGWTAAALHAKHAHGDTAAVGRAREASRSARRRAAARN